MQVSRGSLLVAGLLLLWAGLFGWSFVDFSTTEATGDGFTRGSNRLLAFLQWQFVAGIVEGHAVLGHGATPKLRPMT